MKKALGFLLTLAIILSGCSRPPEQEIHRTPIIVDDDGSMDGMAASLYFLVHPGYEVIALTVSNGDCHPSVFVHNLGRLLTLTGRKGIQVATGQDYPLVGENAFPEIWRDFGDDFFGFQLPTRSEPISELSAPELMVELINASSEPVAIFVSGTHTNLAQALRLDPGIKDNIRWVGVMGGALFVEGNIGSEAGGQGYTNETAEWNIWVDPLAASEVFSSGLPIFLTALDATDQVTWGRDFSRRWEGSKDSAAKLAGELVTDMNNRFGGYVYVWDLTAAIFADDPTLCISEKFRVDVVTEQGPDEGRTIAIQDPNGNVTACLDPDVAAIHARADEVFR
jgi:purine nucleosidase/pyrimidine-specific ribonucleoside hydrolase